VKDEAMSEIRSDSVGAVKKDREEGSLFMTGGTSESAYGLEVGMEGNEWM
jgi:hypothetical protein